VIVKGACFLDGNGTIIDIWKDPWVPWLTNFLPKLKDNYSLERLVVSCLIHQATRSWDLPKLKEILCIDSMEAIKRIPIPLIPILDRLVWMLDPKGKFSVQSAFNNSLPSLTIIPETPWTKISKLNVHERYKMLLWRIGSNILPTNKNFVLRVGSGDPTYPLCHLEEESIVHLFFHCPIARAIWF
jgi:hypothetical protein